MGRFSYSNLSFWWFMVILVFLDGKSGIWGWYKTGFCDFDDLSEFA